MNTKKVLIVGTDHLSMAGKSVSKILEAKNINVEFIDSMPDFPIFKDEISLMEDLNTPPSPISQFKIEPIDVQMSGKESRRLRRKQQRKNKK